MLCVWPSVLRMHTTWKRMATGGVRGDGRCSRIERRNRNSWYDPLLTQFSIPHRYRRGCRSRRYHSRTSSHRRERPWRTYPEQRGSAKVTEEKHHSVNKGHGKCSWPVRVSHIVSSDSPKQCSTSLGLACTSQQQEGNDADWFTRQACAPPVKDFHCCCGATTSILTDLLELITSVAPVRFVGEDWFI